MSELEGQTQLSEAGDEDEQMAGVDADVEVVEESAGAENGAEAEPASNPQTIFLDYLRSPIVELVVGGGKDGDSDVTKLTAHQAILEISPYFSEKLSALSDSDQLQIEMLDDNLDAIGCFLQYQYTGEYFPRRLQNVADGLEADPSIPAVDNAGDQLLKHARVYTLAEKLGLPDLKTLAHSKIHRINSTAVGEIAYARYVYAKTPSDDTTIRKPVAAFWATRSHVLRHEAEDDFKKMCLEFPQFGFDVLSLVLDQREKRAREREQEDTPGRGKKRMRASINI